MNFVFNPSKWKPATKKILALIVAGSLSTQTSWVTNHILPLFEHHPHLAFLGTGLIMLLTLIHNPLAQNIAKQVFSEESTDSQGNLESKTTEVTTEVKPKQ